MNRIKRIITAGVLLLGVPMAFAHVHGMPRPRMHGNPQSHTPPKIQIEPRIGRVSKEVVQEKLKTYGITQVMSLRKVGDTYKIRARVNGKITDLEMSEKTGFLRKAGETEHLKPIGKGRELMIKPRALEKPRELKKPGALHMPSSLNKR